MNIKKINLKVLEKKKYFFLFLSNHLSVLHKRNNRVTKNSVYPVYVMAFLRSFARCNQSLAVSRKFSTSIHSSQIQRGGNVKFSRAELLACQQYYFDLRRDLNTRNKHDEKTTTTSNQRFSSPSSSMSTVAARKVATPPSSSPAAASNPNDPPPQRDPLDVGFSDPIAAFKSKTTMELLRAYFVYIMCSSEYLVENNMKVIIDEMEIEKMNLKQLLKKVSKSFVALDQTISRILFIYHTINKIILISSRFWYIPARLTIHW